jgi:hypothetical protein
VFSQERGPIQNMVFWNVKECRKKYKFRETRVGGTYTYSFHPPAHSSPRAWLANGRPAFHHYLIGFCLCSIIVVGFVVLKAVSLNNTVFWDVTPCGFVVGCSCLEEPPSAGYRSKHRRYIFIVIPIGL